MLTWQFFPDESPEERYYNTNIIAAIAFTMWSWYTARFHARSVVVWLYWTTFCEITISSHRWTTNTLWKANRSSPTQDYTGIRIWILNFDCCGMFLAMHTKCNPWPALWYHVEVASNVPQNTNSIVSDAALIFQIVGLHHICEKFIMIFVCLSCESWI